MKSKTTPILLAILLAPPLNLLYAQANKNVEVTVNGVAGFQDTPLEPDGKWHVHDPARPQPPVVSPGAAFSVGATAPSDAEVLFDGHGLEKWQNMQGAPALWKTNEDYVETAARGGSIRTRGAWADFQLHVEWATPTPPRGEGQGRGNSGILINNMYEVQVLDSYQSKTYADGQAAAVYGQFPPLVNASRAPGQWQVYDIIFHGPRFDANGKLLRPARITSFHNGVLVQDNVELTGPTGHHVRPPYTAGPEKLPLSLQDHGHPVRYRNIWLRELK